MNVEALDSNVAKEVLTILMFSDKYIQDCVPDSTYYKLSSVAADSDKEVILYKDRKLKEQNVSSDALDVYSLIYYLYVATGDEKDEILSSWKMNESNNGEVI